LRGNICPFVIDGNSIDFVDSFPHLGHIISSEPGDNEDISHSRCKFIGQTNSVRYYVTFGTLAQMENIGCLSLFVVICMVASCGIWMIVQLVISVSLGVKLCVERIIILMMMLK